MCFHMAACFVCFFSMLLIQSVFHGIVMHLQICTNCEWFIDAISDGELHNGVGNQALCNLCPGWAVNRVYLNVSKCQKKKKVTFDALVATEKVTGRREEPTKFWRARHIFHSENTNWGQKKHLSATGWHHFVGHSVVWRTFQVSKCTDCVGSF